MGEPKVVELDFKSQFYNLQGTHINERKKNFYKLLKSTSPDISPEQIDIQPRNYQERIFYVDVLIHFKKVDKLIEILKQAIGVLSSRILKQRWFFQEAFKNMSAEDVINNFLPSLPYSLRMKVLKKLSLTLDEEMMDKIFDLVLERYGLFIAKQFLFSCSPEKIVHVLRNNEITLLSEQLKRLLQKDLNLLKVYFEEYKKNMRKTFDDYDFLNYLAWKHPNLFFEFGFNNESNIKLGHYTTRRVIKSNKENVLEDIKNCSLNKAALVRKIKQFDKEYFFFFFPDKMKAINDDTYSSNLEAFICKYPIKKRWEVFSEAFKKAYNKEIVEHLDHFEEKLAMFFPEKIRQKWAEIKYVDSDDWKYLEYYDPNMAFMILKDKINFTSDIHQRGRLLNESISVCFNHKDYATFEEVLKYICKRHRNDDKNVREDMISHIRRNVDFNLITEVHWKYINEIIDIQRVRSGYIAFEIIAEYLFFVYKNKLPLDGPVTAYAKNCMEGNRSFRLWHELREPEMEKTILKHIVKILPTIAHKHKEQGIYEIMSSIVDFNKGIKNDKIFNKEFKMLSIDLNECTLIMDLVKQVCTKKERINYNDFVVVNSLISYNCLYSEIPLKFSCVNIFRYGLFIAKQFLFSCSPEKIIHVLRNTEITLLSEQLKRLLQKDLNLLKVYFEEYKKNMRKTFDDHDFLNYLAWKHPNLFFEFGFNNESNIKLGHYTTRRVIKSNKENVLEDIKNCSLNKGALVRKIKQFDKEYFFLFFPDNMKAINDDTYSSNLEAFICKYPIKKRWEVFSKAFKKAYNKEIIEHLDHFEEKLVMFFPEKIRQKWAEMKYVDSDDLKYLKYYDPNKAFMILKDKINFTSDIHQRGRLLNELISVCFNNKDYATFKEVLKYICKRHRNDDKNVREDMISHIRRNIDFNHITEVHWKYINEIIDIQRVRGGYTTFEIIAEYLFFVYKNKLPLNGPVTDYAKYCIKDNRSFRLWYELREPEMEKTILKHIVKILPTIEHKNKEQSVYELMSSIVDFNKDVKNDKIFNKEFKMLSIDLNECTLIMDLVKQVCTKKELIHYNDCVVVNSLISYNCLYSEMPLKVVEENRLLDIVKTLCNHPYYGVMVYDCISDVIKKPKRDNFENNLLDYFFNNIDGGYIGYLKRAIKYFAAKEPEVVAKYFSVILPLDVKSACKVLDYGFVRKYSHLGLEEEVIAHYKALVLVNSKCKKKNKLLGALSMVMNTSDFLDLVKAYIPDEKKLDIDNAEQKELYEVQCGIAKNLKDLDETSISAPVLMHFCQGDYLQSSLAALYKVLYRINEENAFSYINVLGERAMSTRKIAVFLGFELLPIKDAMSLYSVLSNKETNVSAKKYLLRAVLKFIIKNSLGSFLDTVFVNMNFVNKNDTEMINTLVAAVHKIPNKNKPFFVEKVWTFLDVLEQQEVNVVGYRNTLLNTVNSYGMNFTLKLNKNFCEDLIKKYFLPSDDKLLTTSDTLDYFVINYLLAYLDKQHFKFIFNIIKDYKDKHWEANNDNVKYIFRFFTAAYESFDENNVTFLQLFSKYWQQLFSKEESFTEYVMLQIMVLYKENANIEAFSKEVDKFFQEVITENRRYISTVLFNAIIGFYAKIPTKHNTDFTLGNFAFYLLQSNPSELNCFTAFSIIENFSGTYEQNIYDKVLKALKSVNNSTAMIYCNVLLKNN